MNSRCLYREIFRAEVLDRIAVVFEQREITYAELCLLTDRTAQVLFARNIREGDRVAILLADSPEFIATFLAAMSLGAIAVPINLALGKQAQLAILRDCGACAAIVEAEIASSLFVDSEIGADLQYLLTVARANSAPPIKIDGIEVEDLDRAEVRAIDDVFPVDRSHDQDAFILYTSGSTGEPKGAVHAQSDVFYTNETFCREVLNLREGDRLFSSSRLPFAYGLGNAFTFPLLNGLTSVLCREKPSTDVIERVFRDCKPTIFFGVPVVYRVLLDHHREVRELETSSLRLCITAGEALPAQLGEEWQETFGIELLDGIGSTEMLHMFMSNHENEVRYGSSGKLLRGYDAQLVDHEGNATAPGDVGNLWIRGASAARHYWQRPDISAETFVDDWVRTGDLYRQDADGFWWHMGRSDDCFKSAGQWVSPVEVEGVLLRSERVRGAAVVEDFDQDGLACACAFVVGDDPAEQIEQSLREHCEASLPRFKQPRRYIFIPELPYTATGKVQRFKLREQLRAETRA